MKKMFGWLSVIIIPAMLAGCGLKGPLYFPKEPVVQKQTTAAQPQDTDASAPAAKTAP